MEEKQRMLSLLMLQPFLLQNYRGRDSTTLLTSQELRQNLHTHSQILSNLVCSEGSKNIRTHYIDSGTETQRISHPSICSKLWKEARSHYNC